MEIRQVINNEQEHMEFAWQFLSPPDNKLWTDEEMENMRPFFQWDKNPDKIYPWPEEVKESYEYYR